MAKELVIIIIFISPILGFHLYPTGNSNFNLNSQYLEETSPLLSSPILLLVVAVVALSKLFAVHFQTLNQSDLNKFHI